MNRLLILVGSGLVAVAIGLVFARELSAERAARLAHEAELAAELHALRAAEMPAAPPAQVPPGLAARLDTLEARLLQLENAARRTAVAVEAGTASTGPRRQAADGEVLVEPADATPRTGFVDPERAELLELIAKLGPGYDWGGSTEEMQRFYALAKGTNILADLEAIVAGDPADLVARMELSDAYVATLMTIQGPEQGLWGQRAEDQWREVARQDPDHWQAHFSLGNNFAYYPDVMGKTDEAIRYLEQALEIQERGAQASEHVQTYLSLAQMFRRQGDVEQALLILRAGLETHAPNEQLEAALASLER